MKLGHRRRLGARSVGAASIAEACAKRVTVPEAMALSMGARPWISPCAILAREPYWFVWTEKTA